MRCLQKRCKGKKSRAKQVELRGHEFPEWSATPSDRGFSIRGERTGGGGHKPRLSPVLQEPQGDSGGQTRGSGYAAPDPRVQRTPCTESGAPGDGMAKWVCSPCKRTARQRSRWRLLSSHLKKCKYSVNAIFCSAGSPGVLHAAGQETL